MYGKRDRRHAAMRVRRGALSADRRCAANSRERLRVWSEPRHFIDQVTGNQGNRVAERSVVEPHHAVTRAARRDDITFEHRAVPEPNEPRSNRPGVGAHGDQLARDDLTSP